MKLTIEEKKTKKKLKVARLLSEINFLNNALELKNITASIKIRNREFEVEGDYPYISFSKNGKEILQMTLTNYSNPNTKEVNQYLIGTKTEHDCSELNEIVATQKEMLDKLLYYFSIPNVSFYILRDLFIKRHYK